MDEFFFFPFCIPRGFGREGLLGTIDDGLTIDFLFLVLLAAFVAMGCGCRVGAFFDVRHLTVR